MEIKQSTQFKVPVKLRSSTTGAGLTGKVYTDLTVYIQKQNGSAAQKVLVGASEFVQLDATNFAGVYDLLLSAGDTDTAGFLKYSVACSGAESYHGVLEVVANVEADTYARLGAPVGASISADIAAIPAAPSAATIADAVWDEATAGHVAAGSTGKALTDANNGTPPSAATIAQTVWLEAGTYQTTPGTITPGIASDFVCHVMTLATGLDKTTGTIYAYIRRQSDSYWWSLAGGGSWGASIPVGPDVPLATYLGQGLWRYTFSNVVTAALPDSDRIVCRMTDNETEALATVTSDVTEHSVQVLAVVTKETLADAVWDEATAGHQAAGSTGLALTSGSAPTASAVADEVWSATRDATLKSLAIVNSNGPALMLNATGGAALNATATGTQYVVDVIHTGGGIGARIEGAEGMEIIGTSSDGLYISGALQGIDLSDSGTPLDTATVAQISDGVWDEALVDHTMDGTFGQTLQMSDTGLIVSGGASTATLKAGASAITDFYKNGLLVITSGTGVGQSRSITTYDGGTKVATVDRAWGTIPLVGAGYIVVPAAPSSSLTVDSIADAVWDEDMAVHNTPDTAGAMLLSMAASGGIGSELLTVTVLDPNLDPIQAVAVYCHNVSGALVAHSVTNASGVAILAPGAGVNTVTAYYAGFSFAAQNVTITASVNATAELIAITTTIPVGTSPARCAVYAQLQLADGSPAEGVIGKAHLRSLPQKLSDVFVAGTAITAVSDVDGMISFDLPRGAHCVITIPDHVPRCFIEVPDATSYQLLGTATI